MAVKQYKPTTPARRGMTSADFDEITRKKARKSMLEVKKSSKGRNNAGRITSRRRGGGNKQFYRPLNNSFPDGAKVEVLDIEYDPSRTARIASVKAQDDSLHYIIAGVNMKPGDIIEFGNEAPIERNNTLQLKDIPEGSLVYNIEITPGRGGQMVRSAGTKAQLMAKENNYATLRLPSGEVRLIHETCRATIGSVGNEKHQNIKLGSAGRNRHLGRRPSVRGVVMNAVDHPHGGGDGGSHPIGGGGSYGRSPKTPWGKKTIGYKTRRRKATNKYIVRSRHEAKRK